MHTQHSYGIKQIFDNLSVDRIGVINLASIRMLRWLSISVMLMVVFLTDSLKVIDDQVTIQLFVVISTIAINMVLQISSCRDSVSTPTLPMIELIFDIFAWSIFLLYFDSLENTLAFILLLYVAISSAIHPAKQAWIFGLITALTYSLLWMYHRIPLFIGSDEPVAFHLFDSWLAFDISVVVTILFITRMTQIIDKYNKDLHQARKTKLRDEWIVSLGEVAASTVHELSTPLSTLSMLVAEMRETPEPVTIPANDLKIMDMQLKVCRNALTRLTCEVKYPNSDSLKSCFVDEWMHRLHQTWQDNYPEAMISIIVDSHLSQCSFTPNITLEQALRNVVDNAIAAHPDGIKLSVAYQDGNIEISIIDNGPGIDANTMLHLEQGLPQKSDHGLGLGLALAKSTVERFGGNIIFNNLPRGGTEARVVLPVNEVMVT